MSMNRIVDLLKVDPKEIGYDPESQDFIWFIIIIILYISQDNIIKYIYNFLEFLDCYYFFYLK